MLWFNNCQVSINGTGIMADSANINSESPIRPLNNLGSFNPSFYSPQGILQNSLQISYFLEPENEPNLQIISGLKTLSPDSTLTPLQIVVGGITGLYYLDSYSIISREHETVMASVSYVGYTPLSGNLESQTGITYNAQTGEGVAHYYTSAIFVGILDNSELNYSFLASKTIYNCDYGFKVMLNPITVLGNDYPKVVQVTSMEENVSVVHDEFVCLGLYGNSPSTGLSLPLSNTYVDFCLRFGPISDRPLSRTRTTLPISASINLSSGIAQSQRVSFSINDIAKVNTVILRHY